MNLVGFVKSPDALLFISLGKRLLNNKYMYDALGTLYQSVNISKKMLLKNMLTSTCMRKTDTRVSYLMDMKELSDQIAVVESRF